MRVLFVTPYLPGPPIFGGQRRMHGLMSSLAEAHEVSIVSLVDASIDQSEGIRDAEKFCARIVTVPDRLHRVAGRQKRIVQLGSMLLPQSYERLLYRRPAFQRALDRHLRVYSYDVICCEFVFMAGYRIRAASGFHATRARVVIDEHNVEYDILRRTTTTGRLDRKLYSALNWRKLKREEVTLWKGADGCTLTSRRDEAIVKAEAPGTRTRVIPNGVDIDAFRANPLTTPEPMTLLFFGAINYFPNTDGALYFLRDIFPLLEAKYPRIKLRIVGPGAPSSILAAQSDRIEVTGFVDDLRAEIDRASVVVVPLRIGGGTRLKILEAMAMSKAIVSTTIGAEGIDVAHGRDILLADTPADFAREVGRVLQDQELTKGLGKAARRTAEDRYSWRAAAREMATFYEELLEGQKAVAS